MEDILLMVLVLGRGITIPLAFSPIRRAVSGRIRGRPPPDPADAAQLDEGVAASQAAGRRPRGGRACSAVRGAGETAQRRRRRRGVAPAGAVWHGLIEGVPVQGRMMEVVPDVSGAFLLARRSAQGGLETGPSLGMEGVH